MIFINQFIVRVMEQHIVQFILPLLGYSIFLNYFFNVIIYMLFWRIYQKKTLILYIIFFGFTLHIYGSYFRNLLQIVQLQLLALPCQWSLQNY
ncbi:unnamed protein product [Paramecium primaurelia]|uniref:Uncharacterized protein n=1 Tax=Paramecium primaurelia TaxID=5886 RepID=A0A8S1MFW8_PARPR|nr:unnamed protein product [Paramecium primaurelia]